LETPVQVAAKTLGLPETVLRNLLSLIELPEPATPESPPSLFTPAADLINALIDEYDNRL